MGLLKKMQNKINIQNKKAVYNYTLIEKFTAYLMWLISPDLNDESLRSNLIPQLGQNRFPSVISDLHLGQTGM